MMLIKRLRAMNWRAAAAWAGRMLAFVIVVGGAGYALVSVLLHFGILRLAGDLAIFGAAGVLAATILYYGLWIRWETTPEGRHVMAWTAAAFAMMAYWAGRVIWGSAAALGLESLIFRLLIAAAFLVLGAHRFVLIWQIHHEKRDPALP